MTARLGEYLIKARKITPDQLKQGLKIQGIFGGRIGTNLIELGYLTEEELAHFLSEALRVPFVNATQLHNIPPEVIATVPQDIAHKYMVVPLRISNRRLDLAMLNPLDFHSLEEFSFRTGYIPRPFVAPEMSMMHALEKYYGLRNTRRFIQVSKDMLKPIVPPPVEVTVEEEEVVDFSALPGLVEPAMEAPHLVDMATAPLSTEKLLWDLTEARSRNDVARSVLQHLGELFPRAAFFLVKGNNALGWLATRGHEESADFDKNIIPLNSPSLLRTVIETKNFVYGRFTNEAADRATLAALGGGAPIMAALFPLTIKSRIVAILYLEGDSSQLGQRLGEIQNLVGKVVMAFEILILKNKILEH